MQVHRIFSDTAFHERVAGILQAGVGDHKIIRPQKRPVSVLAQPEPDAAFPLADIAFGQPDIESIAHSLKLKWLHLSTAGFTRYDTPGFRALVKERGLIVTNSSTVYAAACAEHVFAFMLAHARRIPQALRSHAPNGAPEWFQLRGDSISLRGQSVVLLGYGGIASELVKLLVPFDMQITAMRRHPRGDEPVPTVNGENLTQPLTTADHVINLLPDNADSYKFINAARLAQMKSTAVLYNIGRGTTIDQEALLNALRSRQIGAAWLDVTEPEPLPADHPLRSEPHCHITPHIAGGHANEAETLVRHFLGNFQRYLAGTPLRDQIM